MTTETIEAKQKEIERLKREIVLKMEAGEDYSELSRQREKKRSEIVALVEDLELKKIAEQRQTLKDQAEVIRTRIQKQSEAIDAFLAARDLIVKALIPIMEQVGELRELQEKCFAEFHDQIYAGYVIRNAKGFLPADLTISMLQLGEGAIDPYDASRQAFFNIRTGCGLLGSLRRVEIKPSQPPKDPELDLDEDETREIETNCRVCLHENVGEIDKALRDGRPLRELETEFGVSRSTLSRHKRKCLGIEVVRFTDNAV